MSSGTETLATVDFAPTAEVLERVIAAIDRDGARTGSAVDAQLRREAFARFAELPIPGTRPSRGWRHDYAKLKFDGLVWTSDRMTVATSPLAAVAPQEAAAQIDQPALAVENAGGVVHMGATLLEPREAAHHDPRITVAPLGDAKRAGGDHEPGAREFLGEIVRTGDTFVQLGVAFQNCGAYVRVPAGVVLDAPIQLVFANAEPNADAVFPHIIVELGEGARATIVERHVGGGRPFVCGLTVAYVGPGARLDYAVAQSAGEEARVFTHRTARCARGGEIAWHVAELGGTLVRSVVDARLDAEGARADTAALFFNTGMQHVDLTTTTEHGVGPTFSDTVVRSAASDRGQGRYFGNIVIREKAHGADASLRDDALLLAKRAHIDSVPALEIAANDVRAYHGATVGSLDEDALFYAASRGIARPDAVRMVALAFFEPAIARFPGDALRDEVRTALDAKIDAATELGA